MWLCPGNMAMVVSAKLVDWRRIFQNIFCLPNVRKAPIVLLSMFFGKCQPILSQTFADAAPDSTPALPQIEEKGTKTAGAGSSVARSDRSVPQARLAMTFIPQQGTHCPNM